MKVIKLVTGQGLKIKVTNCEFAKEMVYLPGHVVDRSGVRVDLRKVEVIKDIPRRPTRTKLRSFLGTAGYYRQFISVFATILVPLHAAMSNKIKFEWARDMDTAFQNLKRELTTPFVLRFPDFEETFHMEKYASPVALVAVLSRTKEDGKVLSIQNAC